MRWTMNVRAWLFGVGLWLGSASHFAWATEPAPTNSLPPAPPSPALSPLPPQGQPGQPQPERLPDAGNAAVPSPPPGKKNSETRSGEELRNPKWEYCALTATVNRGTNTNIFRLNRRNEKIDAASLKELGEKLKMKKQPATQVDVLNYLGEDGWELVGVTAVSEISTLHVIYVDYVLKRKTTGLPLAWLLEPEAGKCTQHHVK
jgi:hypothetical protein